MMAEDMTAKAIVEIEIDPASASKAASDAQAAADAEAKRGGGAAVRGTGTDGGTPADLRAEGRVARKIGEAVGAARTPQRDVNTFAEAVGMSVQRGVDGVLAKVAPRGGQIGTQIAAATGARAGVAGAGRAGAGIAARLGTLATGAAAAITSPVGIAVTSVVLAGLLPVAVIQLGRSILKATEGALRKRVDAATSALGAGAAFAPHASIVAVMRQRAEINRAVIMDAIRGPTQIRLEQDRARVALLSGVVGSHIDTFVDKLILGAIDALSVSPGPFGALVRQMRAIDPAAQFGEKTPTEALFDALRVSAQRNPVAPPGHMR